MQGLKANKHPRLQGSKGGNYSEFYSSYKATNVSRTDAGITATLISSDKTSISPLFLNIRYEADARLRIRITDPNNDRYEVPYPWSRDGYTKNKGYRRYEVLVRDTPFSVQVVRVSDKTVVFDTTSHELIYTDQFLSLGTRLPSGMLYGIGEDSAPLLRNLNQRTHTLWNSGGYYEQGQGVNLYGTHPFYLNLEQSGRANGVLLMNSNAMDIMLSESPPAVQWNTIGGILDFTIFLGNDPVDVVKLYTQRIGRPFLPPMWALGFHLSRWGFNNTGNMRSVIDSMVDQSVPVDVLWNDIDYMDQYKDFTFDEVRYKDLPSQIEYLHTLGKRHIPILDPAILAKFKQGYLPADSGLEADVFIRKANGDLIVGNVWPGDTVFPNFLSSQTKTWWSKWISNLHEKLQFDGVWIDMNEPQTFYDGSRDGCPWSDRHEAPPYTPKVRHQLQWGTLCLTATQGNYLHYDVHNLYGWSMAQATRHALKELRPGNRTFILSRSTFVGSGQWTAHWTGDVRSSWDDLMVSIPNIINMNMFGIPMVGADICGFEGNSNRELCIRWSQLGAYYPFSRNHNTLYGAPQEPTAWDTEATAIIRSALHQRYHIILHLYGLFVKAHNQGDPVIQGLFMQFPTDPMSFDKDRQFLWGSGVMVCPTLVKGATTTWIYFPPALWYDIWTLQLVSRGGQVVHDYPSPLETINVFARGGTIIPMVTWSDDQTPSAEAMLATPAVSLYCYLDKMGNALGELYVDDGFTEDPGRDIHHVQFSVSDKQLIISPTFVGSPSFVKRISRVLVGGIQGGHVTSVYLNDSPVEFEFKLEGVLDILLQNEDVLTREKVYFRWEVENE